jgi:hypothetical protein
MDYYFTDPTHHDSRGEQQLHAVLPVNMADSLCLDDLPHLIRMA